MMLLFLAVLTQIRVIAEAKIAKVYFILMTLVALYTLMFAWHFSTLYYVAINKASLIVVEGNQLLDATIVVSLAISLSSAGVTHMHKMPGSNIRVVATRTMAIRAVVMVMVVVVAGLWLSLCHGCP